MVGIDWSLGNYLTLSRQLSHICCVIPHKLRGTTMPVLCQCYASTWYMALTTMPVWGYQATSWMSPCNFAWVCGLC